MKIAMFGFLLSCAAAVAVAVEPPVVSQVEPVGPEHAAKMKAGLEIFQRDVRQVLVGRCVKCHGGEKTEGEFDLNTREGLLKGGVEGIAVKPGDSRQSRLVRLITHAEEPNMPEDGAKLPDAQIAAIIKWIDSGAPYDKALVEKDADPNAWTQKRVDAQNREFWSFLPLRRSESPRVANESWCATPIDRFVLARLEEHQLTPNPPADRRKLIRRVYFDLIGLPPSAEQVEAFANDPDPEAYKKLLDQLLENPHYGERWGRHWLDVARFAESHGFEQDYDRPHAFHYRDFVIRALNQDMPYNQFVRWQLAGDEFEPENPLALMATGFLGAGVFPTQLTEKEFESARYDELDDMTATVGTAMLGLTVGCARCHDHKFDPIPAADYYRMVATFATAIRSNVELDLDPKTTREALAKWERERAPLAAALAKFEQTELPARFDSWLAEQLARIPGSKSDAQGAETLAPWMILELKEPQSQGGAVFTRLDDGSYLASGPNADFDKYTFVAHTSLTGISAVRLEAFAHESMTKGGPGRAGNGNIGLSQFSIVAEPLDGKGPAVPVKLKNPRATFEQNASSLSIAASIDADPKSGWAVDPQFGKNHAAVFEMAEPLGFEQGTKLTITLEFNVNHKHNIGRPRLAISKRAPSPALDGEAQPQEVAEVLAILQRRPIGAAERATLSQWYRTTDAAWRKLHQTVAEHDKSRPKPKLTSVMVVSEGVKPIPHHADDRGFPHFYKDSYFLKRGSPDQKHGIATSGFLQVLTGSEANGGPAPWQVAPSNGARTSFRRRALANWITDADQGAGHLLARVIVNRVWQHHLGRGLVATPNDFGVQGQRPTHPELLDWLALQLIENGWHLKPLHKLIMTSAVYTQGTAVDESDALADPDNEWYSRRTSRRLEAEVIRDAMLAASGTLDETLFGPGTLDEAHKRRSIYFMVKRSRLIPSMQIFDAPEPLVSVGDRPSTTIAPQALMFMNNPQVRLYARNFGQRLAPTADKSLADAVRTGYLAALGRPPTAVEAQEIGAFVDQQTRRYQSEQKPNPRELALADFCQVLLSLNEFVYVE